MFSKYILKCEFVSQTNVDQLYINAFKSEENIENIIIIHIHYLISQPSTL